MNGLDIDQLAHPNLTGASKVVKILRHVNRWNTHIILQYYKRNSRSRDTLTII